MRCVSHLEGQVGPVLAVSSGHSSVMPTPAPELPPSPTPEPLEGSPAPRVALPSPRVSLPARYRARLGKAGGRGESGDEDLGAREKDLGTALKWIRQEILLMKEQDQSLMKQFIELRTSILQLRCLYQHQGSSALNSREGSTSSLTDARPPHARLITRAESDFLDFASRTKSLLALQGSPTFTRIKWRSDEYI